MEDGQSVETMSVLSASASCHTEEHLEQKMDAYLLIDTSIVVYIMMVVLRRYSGHYVLDSLASKDVRMPI